MDGNQFHAPAALSAGPIQKKSMRASVPICKLRKRENPPFLAWYPTACILVTIMTELPRLPLAPRTYNETDSTLNCIQLNMLNFVWFLFLIIIGKNIFVSQVNCLPHGDSFMFLTFLYQFQLWCLWLAFCYFYLCLPMKVLRPISRCHLLLLSTYFKSYLSTAWSQLVIHSCRICYIAISNIQRPYIPVSVSCDTKEHQYTFRTASYSRSDNQPQTKLSFHIDCL